jgi:hypothetical protein
MRIVYYLNVVLFTTGNPAFVESRKLSAKANKPSAKALPTVGLGTGLTENFFSRPRLFAEHPSSRLSAEAVPRAHSGPPAKKSSR